MAKSDVTQAMKDIMAGKTRANVKTDKLRGRAIVRGGAGTAARTIGLFGGILTYAVELGIIEQNPVHGVRKPKDQVNARRLSEQEYRRLGKILREAIEDRQYETTAEIIRVYHPTLRLLGAEAGVPFDTVARRMAMLMRVVAPPEEWSADVERRITQHSENVGLKLTYRRPRSLVAHEAFGMLVTELCDAGVVEWVPSYAREILLVADPPGNLIDPGPKPPWLDIPEGEELGRHPSKEWLATASEALPIANAASDGRIVLAELTRVTSRSNERAEEIRSSVIAHKDWRFDEDAEPSVEDFLHREWYLARDYPVLWRLDHDTPFVAIAGGSLFSDVRFLALNPHVGFEMGWTPAMDGLFRWVDRSGATVVESVRWASGNVEVHDAGGYKQRAAEGWLVLVSPNGWDVLAPKLVHAVRHRRAARTTGYKRHGERELNVASDRVQI